MSKKAPATGRYVCPQQGIEAECGDCHAPFPHVREEYVFRGQKVPSCDTHGVKLIPAVA